MQGDLTHLLLSVVLVAALLWFFRDLADAPDKKGKMAPAGEQRFYSSGRPRKSQHP